MQKKIRGLNSASGTLMSGLEIQHDKDNDKLLYPGAANALQDVSGRAMGMRLKEKKAPGFLTSGIATQHEIEDFINNHEKANEMKEEIAFNEKRRKANKPALLGLAPAGAALGAALPMVGAGALEAVKAKKGQILNNAMKGAKAMIAPGKVSDMNSFTSKYSVPLAGAGVGLVGGLALAGKLNGMHRDKVVGKKKDQILNDISYDLDKHMRNKDTIKRIADNSTFRAIGNSEAADELAVMEKKAGYKRDLRIARAEAKATTPKLMSGYMRSPEEVKKYQQEMSQYGDAIESFLNSKDRYQDWNTKKKLARLSIDTGESSKNIMPETSTKSFVNKRIMDKHSNKVTLPKDNSYGKSYIREEILRNHPEFNGHSLAKPALLPTTPKDRLDNIKKGKQSMKDYVKWSNRRHITSNDTNLAKQLESGTHKQKRYSIQDLKADGVYFKTHSEEKPFNLAGFDGTKIKRNFTGDPSMPKKGIPIWASKLPEVSTTYGDTVLAFKPNEAMIAGASPIDHPHLATDTRFMNKKQIGRVNGWNQKVELNRNPEYERVFTYDRKNMDKSTIATYSKHRVGHGNKFDQGSWEFTKNKPGSLADRYARMITNGPQQGYASEKEIKRLDRKALRRKANEILSIEPGKKVDMSAINSKHQLPSKVRELAKNKAFRKNMLLTTGALATAGLVGYNAYKTINDAKKKRDFLKQKEKEEKTANQVHHELMIEKMAITGK